MLKMKESSTVSSFATNPEYTQAWCVSLGNMDTTMKIKLS